MWQFLFKDEADQIVGTCFEVDNENECGFGTCVKIGKLGIPRGLADDQADG